MAWNCNLLVLSHECGTSKQQKLPNNYSYVNSERSMTLMDVQSAIQGSIAHCKKFNYIDGK